RNRRASFCARRRGDGGDLAKPYSCAQILRIGGHRRAVFGQTVSGTISPGIRHPGLLGHRHCRNERLRFSIIGFAVITNFFMPLAAFPKCYLDALCVRRDMTVDQWIDLALQFDVDGLEFYWGFIPHDNPSEWERLRRKVESQHRAIPMMCYSSDFTKLAKEERDAEIDLQKQAIRATAALGGKYCRVLSGQRRPEVPFAQGMRWVQECILELLPFAEM